MPRGTVLSRVPRQAPDMAGTAELRSFRRILRHGTVLWAARGEVPQTLPRMRLSSAMILLRRFAMSTRCSQMCIARMWRRPAALRQ